MTIRFAVCCAALLAFTASAWGAEKPAVEKKSKTAQKSKSAQKSKTAPKSKTARKPAQKPPSKLAAKPQKKPHPKAALRTAQTPVARTQNPIHKTSLNRNPAPVAPAPAHAPSHALHGKTEILTCRNGTEDRHARIGVVLVGGRTDSFAYYSKWKPRTCSIYLQRQHDPHSKWTDKGNVTNVSTDRGLFMIEHGKGEYRFVFRDVDRERYCGMDGVINGTLTIRKGSGLCELTGIMEEGVLLGQANAHLEQVATVAAVPEAPHAPPPAPVRQAPRSLWKPPESAFPRSAND